MITNRNVFLVLFITLNYFTHNLLAYGSVYGYLSQVGVPEAKRIRELEEKFQDKGPQPKIVGGKASALGENPWQAGLLATLVGTNDSAVCGASLISGSRLVTAAHCWYDGVTQAESYTVVLGSLNLFEGGIRLETSNVVMHPFWEPVVARNDIAVIYLPDPVELSNIISPIVLPSLLELTDSLEGEIVDVSGYGLSNDSSSISYQQTLQHVNLKVISNLECARIYSIYITPTNICAVGAARESACRGDSGGPLALHRNNVPVLVGITSFGPSVGCELGLPGAFTRVTAYLDFIDSNL